MTTQVERGHAKSPDKYTRLWLFPREGEKYADAVSEKEYPDACEHGHLGCALWDNGPCADEALHAWEESQQRRLMEEE